MVIGNEYPKALQQYFILVFLLFFLGEPELTWYLNGVPAVMDTRVKSVKLTPEAFELQFAKTTADDNGNWAVIAKNAHGEMSQFFSFAALMMPKFEEKLKDMEANEGKQVSKVHPS